MTFPWTENRFKVPCQLVKDPPDIGFFDAAFFPSHIYERRGKMPQPKFVGDAACFLNVDRRGMKVVVKYGKVIPEAFHNVL